MITDREGIARKVAMLEDRIGVLHYVVSNSEDSRSTHLHNELIILTDKIRKNKKRESHLFFYTVLIVIPMLMLITALRLAVIGGHLFITAQFIINTLTLLFISLHFFKIFLSVLNLNSRDELKAKVTVIENELYKKKATT